jgi:orotidine-5'-phosphate decarboxylase
MIRNLLEMKNTLNKNPKERLIFALDNGSCTEEAMSWVDRLKDHVGLFKIGKESFSYHGPDIVRRIRDRECQVFLDLKFHDIPNTVAAAAVAAVNLGVTMFNVHALGGLKMMEDTVTSTREAARRAGLPIPLVLAVTVLTSLNDDDLRMMGFNRSAGELALSLARMAQDAGVSGVVASAHDVENIRRACGQDFVIVSPGIRANMTVEDDQKRTWTAKNAIASGADYIVVGRPIRKAADPVQQADRIILEIAEGLAIKGKVI